MTYKDACILSEIDGKPIEGFIKCTYVVLYNKKGKPLFTVKKNYAYRPDMVFVTSTKWKGWKNVIYVPIGVATRHVEGKYVPITPSEELKETIRELITSCDKARDKWTLIREWKKDAETGQQKGDKETLTTQINVPDDINASALSDKQGEYEWKFVIDENTFYTLYWLRPEYDYVLKDHYIELLNILENNEEVNVKHTALDWMPDVAVVSTINDDILTDEYGEIITDEDGNPETWEYGTDKDGNPIFPDTTGSTEALQKAKQALDQAKAVLAAAGATMFL